jgi:hypothetical protein
MLVAGWTWTKFEFCPTGGRNMMISSNAQTKNCFRPTSRRNYADRMTYDDFVFPSDKITDFRLLVGQNILLIYCCWLAISWCFSYKLAEGSIVHLSVPTVSISMEMSKGWRQLGRKKWKIRTI